MTKSRLFLILLPLLAILLLSEVYSWTSRGALEQQLDQSLGPWGSWLAPLLYRFSPDIADGIGGYLHARSAWGWSWPAALFYGFPGIALVLALVSLYLGLNLWQLLGKWFAGRQRTAKDGHEGRTKD